ncbi:hypothetical protein [Acidipropionibacterium acidipropionici]|uniref:hypothetical protein n=2 Tax=Acidipropionibacterium acidipropionici TaxID=1748 RepID=UPI00147021FB|nr:hypothetical protein [Acidipropionibacterium acidipropionici]
MSIMSACFMHSAEQALPIIMQVFIICIMASVSHPAGRIIIRMQQSAISAMSMHMSQQAAIPSPVQAEAHIVQAVEHEFMDSMHSFIMSMSMGISAMDVDFIISIISISGSFPRSPGNRPPAAACPALWFQPRSPDGEGVDP